MHNMEMFILLLLHVQATLHDIVYIILCKDQLESNAISFSAATEYSPYRFNRFMLNIS